MKSTKGNTRPITTVNVTDSQTVTRPDGTTALVLWTQELGPIAFRVDLRAVELLRSQLADAETILRTPIGRA